MAWSSSDKSKDDYGSKPSELYKEYIWKISKFSEINKRAICSNTLKVGGYKWYILLFPQGCDDCNHLSLFLGVADHDKLLPGWIHLAQYTLCVVNKDPKKSKYAHTLHRFWKKEHEWGWKKFMELSKVVDNGFLDDDTLIIKAHVQVIRERIDCPFQCLDSNYKAEIPRVYWSKVEEKHHHIEIQTRARLEKLIQDKLRWSSFCNYWLGFDQRSRHRLSRVNSDFIWKGVVKHLFIENQVTSTLLMDSLYSGLKAIKGQTETNKVKPIVQMESDTFVLADDVLPLLEEVVLEPLPLADEKDPRNCTKDGNSSNDCVENYERRLAELGRRTIEFIILVYISSKIEEVLVLKREEDLIQEDEREKAKPKPNCASGK